MHNYRTPFSQYAVHLHKNFTGYRKGKGLDTCYSAAYMSQDS